MQSRDLTINFNATAWFSKPNNYDSYTQMYERAGAAGKDYMLPSDPLNPAAVRARVDDGVTLPQSWDTASGATPMRGLSPGAGFTASRVANQMKFGKAAPVLGPTSKNSNTQKVAPGNPHFNPKTKQVFAALNYGRRPHGSTVGYGRSHLILSDSLKAGAIYYPKDTFAYMGNEALGIDQQFPYSHLAAAIAYNSVIAKAIISSCLHQERLADTSSTIELLEAHLHVALRFDKNIKAVMLAESDPNSVIARNARLFADKWGASLVFVDP